MGCWYYRRSALGCTSHAHVANMLQAWCCHPIQVFRWPGKGIYALMHRKPERTAGNPNCTGLVVQYQWLAQVGPP